MKQRGIRLLIAKARALIRDARGMALVEFALVAPVFIMTLFGIISYGGYFWRAHALQQVANDAARAALPGLTKLERDALARATITTELPTLGGIAASKVGTPSVSDDGITVTVTLSYNGNTDPFLNLGIVPLPSKTIRRMAAVRLGGL